MLEIQPAANNPDKRNYGGAERVLFCLVRSIEAAENAKLTHEQFIQAIEDAMGSAVVNGEVKGALKRKLK